MLLPDDWKSVVKKLSAILRIADAFDRTHNFLIQDVNVKTKKAEVIFYVDNKLENIEIELWSLDRRKKLFESLFEKEIKVKSNG
jgi:exopolyphosphatase/guanosine-5'-triphosphate,3'-diphosphate pyrophosphatase